MDRALLEILCCPVSRVPLQFLSKGQLEAINGAIAAGSLLNVDGVAVSEPLREGLITRDGRVAYPIIDGIPVLLPESGIATAQFATFPT